MEISADDLARLSNVSVRTLYDRFKKVKGMSPSAYIKARKLRRIYQHIQTATNKVRNVTEVALEYGFSHLGRFSSEYKLLFGELPSETLRRRSESQKS
jgi:AraC-like DNA-binding protein